MIFHRTERPSKLPRFQSTLLLGILAFAFHSLVASLCAAEFAWQDTNNYRPPNFEATFLVEPEAGRRLEQFWRNIQREKSTPEQDYDLLRRGLRTCPIDTQTMVLRWFGNKYIWGKSPQNPEAIELMYHAAGSTNSSIRYYAIYFGISTVRPMTDPILHALVDIAIQSEDPNLLSRVAWSGAADKDRQLHYLDPYLSSENPARREHAEVLRKIFSGELKAFAWAAEQARQKAQAKFADQLNDFRMVLEKGESKARSELLEMILRERVALIMDESFIPAFAAAATDTNADVRKKVAIIVGQRWIWEASEQAPAAIDLAMKLSRDPDRGVRYNANYYGLSTIRHRTDDEVARMLEMALHDGLSNADFRGRINWGLEKNRELVRTVLKNWIENYKTDPIKAVFAYGFHSGFLKEEPATGPDFPVLLETAKPVAMLVGFLPSGNWKPNSLEEFTSAVLNEVPETYRSPVRWNTDEIPILIVAPSEVAAIEKSLEGGGRFKIGVKRQLSAQNLIDLGKGKRLQEIR